MIDNEMIQDATKMIKSNIQRLNKLKDKVVLAHSLSNSIWVYYGAIVFCVFFLVARWPA
jgi:hypothetical protein